MKYEGLSKEEFDAIVTGELTHYALWFEEEFNGIITDYFVENDTKLDAFKRLLLYRDGLTFQDKIEIVRAMIPLFKEVAEKVGFKKIINNVSEFKSKRNAMAHGLDVTDNYISANPTLKIKMVSRSGKVIVKEITNQSHAQIIDSAENLLIELQSARREIHSFINNNYSPIFPL